MTFEGSQQYLLNVKMNFTIDDITKGLPRQVNLIFRYISSLKIYEKPDYNYIKKILGRYLNARLIQINIKKHHFLYDWIRLGLLKNISSEFKSENIDKKTDSHNHIRVERRRKTAWEKIDTDAVDDDDESHRLDADMIHNLSSK